MDIQVVQLTAFGGPEVLVATTAPAPVAGPGQVVVDAAFANITFVETQFRATGFGPFPKDLPVVPGNGVGGVVTGVGDGVDDAWLDRRVVTSTGGSGGYASKVAVDVAGLVAVPEEVAIDDATALLADGRTALWLADAAAVQTGARALVLAAAGGVGTLLVQVLADAGAEVVGAAGGERKADVVRSLEVGAVDYSADGWTDDLEPFDVLFDGVGGELGRTARSALDDGGRVLAYGAASGGWAETDDRLVAVQPPRPSPAESVTLTTRALDLAATGRLRPIIGQRFPLADAAAAHRAIESRSTVGKTLLVVG